MADVMFTNGGVVSETAPAGLVYCASFNHSGLGRSTVGALMFGRNAATSSAAAEGPLVEWVSVANDSTQAAAAALVESTLYREVRDWVTASAYGTDNHSSSIPDLLGWTTPNGFATVVERVAASTTLASLRYPVASSDYSFEVELGSTDEGANTLGVCAAFARVGGKDHGLYALRTPGGLVLQSEAESLPGGDIYKLFSVGYNLLQNDAIDLGSTNTGLVWGDGVADADRGTEGAYTTPFHGWDVAGACRIRVTRAGNLIEIETSQLGETDVALGQSVTIDLTSRPELAVFLGPTTWGLVTYAQAEASFDFISRPGFYEPYVELSVDGSGADTSTVNFYNGASWTSQPLTLASEFIRPGRLYYSPINEQLFFAQRNGNLRRMVLGA